MPLFCLALNKKIDVFNPKPNVLIAKDSVKKKFYQNHFII